MGEEPPLVDQVRQLGTAMAQPETGDYHQARLDLLQASNEHALLDVTGIIAWHAFVSKVVDVAGFYSNNIPSKIDRLAHLLVRARTIRRVLMGPLVWISRFVTKPKQV